MEIEADAIPASCGIRRRGEFENHYIHIPSRGDRTEIEPELRKTLPEWFHRELGKTGFTWAAPDYYAISEVDR